MANKVELSEDALLDIRTIINLISALQKKHGISHINFHGYQTTEYATIFGDHSQRGFWIKYVYTTHDTNTFIKNSSDPDAAETEEIE